jgi:hypothetical protein
MAGKGNSKTVSLKLTYRQAWTLEGLLSDEVYSDRYARYVRAYRPILLKLRGILIDAAKEEEKNL